MIIEDYNELVFLEGVLRKIGFDLEGIQSTAKYVESMLSLNPQVLIISTQGKQVDLSLLARDLKKRPRPPKTVMLVSPNQNVEDLPLFDVDIVLSSPVRIDKLIDAISDQLGIDPVPLLTKYNKLNVARTDQSMIEDKDKSDLSTFEEFKESLQFFKGEKKEKPQPEPASRAAAKGTLSTQANMESTPANVAAATLADRQNIHNNLNSNSITPPVGGEASVAISPSQMTSEERNARFEKLLGQLTLPESAGFSRDLVEANNKELRSQEKKTSLYDLEAERKKFVKNLFGRRK